MAKLKTSALLSAVRGSLNGSSIQGNNGSTSLRKKTGRHAEIKTQNLAGFSPISIVDTLLKNLSQESKKALEAELKNFRRTDTFGEEYKPTLRNEWIRRVSAYGVFLGLTQLRRINIKKSYQGAINLIPKPGNPEILLLTQITASLPPYKFALVWVSYSKSPGRKPEPAKKIFFGKYITGLGTLHLDVTDKAPIGWNPNTMPYFAKACLFDSKAILPVASSSLYQNYTP